MSEVLYEGSQALSLRQSLIRRRKLSASRAHSGTPQC